MYQSSTLLCLFLAVTTLFPLTGVAQSNVPIDSPRGNYEGADNIHWYQQKALRVDDNLGLLPEASDPWLCDQANQSDNCFGNFQREPQESYFVQGRVPIKAAIFVDSRTTPGFDFPFRRVIDSVRRANDAFARSGVLAHIFITKVRWLDFDAEGYSYDPSEIYDQVYGFGRDLLKQTARDDEADVVVYVRNTEGERDAANGLCGWATVGIYRPFDFLTPQIILACEDETSQTLFSYAPTTSAHEFGHVIGLAHQTNSSDSATPHLQFGRGFYAEESDLGTIMSTQGRKAPFFSSPFAFYEGWYLGDESNSAVRALNQSVSSAALYWERRYGRLRPPQSSGGKGEPSIATTAEEQAAGDLPGQGSR